tara:strand:+ start:866 stop:3925 length:3060 start_codon:yes stop_codon:yes gene_type:complete
MAIQIPDFNKKKEIVIPDFKKKKEIVIPDFEKEIKEIEVPKNSLERDFPGMTTSEIIETGGKGYTEEERRKNIVIPDLSKQGFFKKALPITHKQIEYIWKEPLGLSEDNRKKVQKVIGDEDTLLGKFNNILVDSLSVGIDTTLRAGNTLGFAFTGFAGDTLNGIYEAIDKNPNGAGERLTRDLNGMLIEMMGRSGSFSNVPGKKNTIKSKKTNEEITDVFVYANKSPENKLEVKKNIEKIVDNELTEIKKNDTIIGESLKTDNKIVETNKINEIVKAKEQIKEQPKIIDTKESLNRSPALNQNVVNKITEASVKFANEENIKLVPTKEKPLSLQMQEIFLSDKYDTPYLIRKIAEDNKIPVDTFLNYVFPSVSQSAKEMAAWSRASRYLKDRLDPTGQIMSGDGAFMNTIKRLDNLRRGLLVTRIATAVRNYASQTARITIDSLQNVLDYSMQQAIKPFVKPDQFVKNQRSPLTSLDQLVTNFKQWKPSNYKKVKEETNKILDQFPNEKNRLFLRYTSDIVTASGGKGKNSKINKYLDKAQEGVDFLNFFNKTQEYITRRAVVMARLNELIKANPKYYNNKNLQQILRDGEHSVIRMSDVANAVDKALEVTFAKEFNPYKKGITYESIAATVIQTINRLPFFLTAIVPFPRFLMNSLRFHAEFSPLGFLRFLSKTDRAKIARGDTSGLSRALIGTSTLFAAMALRKQDYAGEKWYEFKIGDRTIDTRPYNPLAAYLFVGDVINRYMDGTLRDIDMKDIVTVFAGIRGTTGLYIFDQIADYLAKSNIKTGSEKFVGTFKKFLGELLAGYLTPLQNVTDFMAEIYPEMRKSRDTSEEPFTGAFKKRIISTDLPEATSPTNFIVNKDGTTSAAPYVKESPAVGQITGLRFISPKNPAEKEFDKLQIKYGEIYRSTGIPELDRKYKDIYSYLVGNGISNYVQTRYYNSLSFNQKVFVIKNLLNAAKRETKKRLQADTSLAPYLLQYNFNNLSREKRKLINDSIGIDYIDSLIKGLKDKQLNKK